MKSKEYIKIMCDQLGKNVREGLGKPDGSRRLNLRKASGG
jgi:hypothetical protein